MSVATRAGVTLPVSADARSLRPLVEGSATAYRAFRVFVIQGTDDRYTTQQFSRSTVIYGLATLATAAYLLLLVAGVVVAWRRGDGVLLPLLLIAYVPLTTAARLVATPGAVVQAPPPIVKKTSLDVLLLVPPALADRARTK